MTNVSPRVLLPLLMLTGVLMMGVRLGDVWDAVANGKLFSPVSQVQAAAEEKKDEHAKTETASAASAAKKTEEPKADAASKPAETKRDVPPEASGATPESDLYKQLAGRRDQLDKRAQELDEREAFVVVTEKRVDQKIKEMEVMRTQLQTLLGQAGAAQQAQIENLVKIYEIMKPKEAAKIFETLDMPILLGVVQKMKAARTAAVLAEMNPEKAKEITTALTKQDQLPQVK